MERITASILVSRGQLQRGIQPSYTLLLYENDESRWVLSHFGSERDTKIVWIPKNALDDALLMVAIYVAKDEEIVRKARTYFKDLEKEISLKEMDDEKLEELYHLCQKNLKDHEINMVVTALIGSGIFGNLKVLSNYPVECEVCPTSFARKRDYWSRELGPYQKVEITKGIVEFTDVET